MLNISNIPVYIIFVSFIFCQSFQEGLEIEQSEVLIKWVIFPFFLERALFVCKMRIIAAPILTRM